MVPKRYREIGMDFFFAGRKFVLEAFALISGLNSGQVALEHPAANLHSGTQALKKILVLALMANVPLSTTGIDELTEHF